MPDPFLLRPQPVRRVLPIVAPSTVPPGVELTAALDFGGARTTVARQPGSVRRTSHLDSLLSGSHSSATVVLTGAARDVSTDLRGRLPGVLAEASLRAELRRDRTFASLAVSPAVDTTGLVDIPVGRGFRAALDAALPGERAARTPLYLLLDDLPVMLVIGGYASLFNEGGTSNPGTGAQRDVCAGFRDGGVMMRAFDDHGSLPISIGPAAGRLTDDDAFSWHAIGELEPGAMRRRRLVEVRSDPVWSYYAYFRDTYRASATEPEIVMHEYQVHGTLDDEGNTVTSCQADPLTLPWPECPHAASSAGWIVGQTTASIADTVRVRYRGTDTCTHLNDLIRSLGDLGALAGAVR